MAIYLYWASLTAFALSALALVHPYVTYPLSLALLRQFKSTPLNVGGPEPQSFAILCCAYNEIHVIEKKIQNLLEVKKRLGNCRVYLYSDGSTDGTNEVIRRFENDITVVISEKRLGKTAGINHLKDICTEEIIIFTDANVLIDVDSVDSLKYYFRDSSVGCITGHLIFVNPNESETARVSAFYRGFEERLKRLETDTGSVVYADGTLFAIRSMLFARVPADLTDDLFTALTVLIRGYRNIAADKLIAREKAATARDDEFNRRKRIGCHVFNCHRLLWPAIRRLDKLTVYKYISHKLLRWLSGYFLLTSYLSFLHLVGLSFGVEWSVGALTLTVLLAACGMGAKRSLLAFAYEGIAVTIAIAIGVYLSVRGEKFELWNSAGSSRN
jgi:cellulose synthase/poly-beta-1,6-N-acetylglucosamine synthase-like glycosyltransferase